MLARPQVKRPIQLLLVLTVAAELCILAGVVQSGVGGWIGVLMQQGSAQLCSAYLTRKLEWLNTYNYDLVFFCACGAAALGAALLAVLVGLLLKLLESEEAHFPHFSLNTFYLLYILYSLALMLMVPGAGDYLTLLVQKGKACTGSYQLHWLTIGGVLIAALLLLLIAWVYLFVLKLRFEEPVVEGRQELLKIPVQVMVEATVENALDLILMEQRIKGQQEQKSELKEPLVDSLDSEDQASVEEGDKEKIACVDFREYKRKQEAQRIRQEEEERVVQELLAIEQAKRDEIKQHLAEERAMQLESKKKLSSLALSPDDDDFEKMLEQSEKDFDDNVLLQPQDISISQQRSSALQEPCYPANYVPVDKEDEQRFKQFKRKLLEKYNIKKPKRKRHLQNIEGGRSKKQIQRALSAHKKPPRTIEYYQSKLKSSYVAPIQEVQGSEAYSSSKGDKNSAFTFKEPELQIREPPTMMQPDSRDPGVPERSGYHEEGEEPPSRLVFEKRAEKSPIRKKLFEEETNYLKNMSMGSVLGTIVKGVVQSSHRTRLLKIKKERDYTDPDKRKKNEKLIDFIRSKYT